MVTVGSTHCRWESGERRTLRMPYMLVRHKVEDYERWKPGFEEHGATRKESGSKGVRLFRNADDPNETVILLEWDDLENARQFAQSDDLREAMQRVQTSPLNVQRMGGVTMAENHVSTRSSIARKPRKYQIDEGLDVLFLRHANYTDVSQTLWRDLY